MLLCLDVREAITTQHNTTQHNTHNTHTQLSICMRTHRACCLTNLGALGEPGCPSTVQDLYNPQTNAQCAVHILNSQGLNAWQTWSEGKCNGAYRLLAVQRGCAPHNTHTHTCRPLYVSTRVRMSVYA